MSSSALRLLAVPVALLALTPSASGDEGDGDPQQAKTFESEITVPVKLDYLLYLPEGYEDSDDRYPLLLFLHGAGESGDDLEKVKAHGPPKLVEQGKDFPFIIASPQSPEFGWEPEELNALIDAIASEYRVDNGRLPTLSGRQRPGEARDSVMIVSDPGDRGVTSTASTGGSITARRTRTRRPSRRASRRPPNGS